MQDSDVTGSVRRGIPVQALVADADMLTVAQDGIASWSRANNGDFYAMTIEMRDAAARDNLASQLTNSIRMLSA